MVLFMFSWWLIGAFYLFVACAIIFQKRFYKYLNAPRFRNDQGDRTLEVGYEEDSVGHVIKKPTDDFNPALSTPHIQASGNQRSGPM